MLEYEIDCYRTTIKHAIVRLQVLKLVVEIEEAVVVLVLVEGKVVVRLW